MTRSPHQGKALKGTKKGKRIRETREEKIRVFEEVENMPFKKEQVIVVMKIRKRSSEA